MVKTNKELVKKRFAKSLKTYAEHALVQRETAERLMFELCAAAGEKFGRILEIGCGSGLLTRMISQQIKYKNFIINDLVEECAALTNEIKKTQFLPGDIEKIEPLPEQLNLIISNATFQWLDHLPTVFGRLAKTVAPGGVVAFSTFGPRNACEIAEVTGKSLRYLSVPELKATLSEHFRITCCHENIRCLRFAHPLAVLKHLKNTGVTAVSSEKWTKSGLQNFIESYIDRSNSNSGVTLTYHPIVVVAELKQT